MAIATAELAPLAETTLIVPMTHDEALICVTRVRQHLGDARREAYELWQRDGWKALGYSSWLDCVSAEFGESQAHLYRLLTAARVERRISPMGEVGRIPERQLREVARLPEEEQPDAWREIVETAPDGKVTAAHAAAVVDHRRAPESPPSDIQEAVAAFNAWQPPTAAAGNAAAKAAAAKMAQASAPSTNLLPVPTALVDPPAPASIIQPDQDFPGSRTGPMLRGIHGAARKESPEGAGADCFQTPPAALKPLIPYLRQLEERIGRPIVIWEPACGKGNIVRTLRGHGFQSLGTDILAGDELPEMAVDPLFRSRDFLTWDPEQEGMGPWDAAVTNPPYGERIIYRGERMPAVTAFIKRRLELGRPAAFLMPYYVLGTPPRFDCHRQDPPQLMVFRERLKFETPSGRNGDDSKPQFDVAWFCWGLNLPRDIIFVDLADDEPTGSEEEPAADLSTCDRCGAAFVTTEGELIGLRTTGPKEERSEGAWCCPACAGADEGSEAPGPEPAPEPEPDPPTRATAHERAQGVACPTCRAGVGEPCTNYKSQRQGHAHSERRKAAGLGVVAEERTARGAADRPNRALDLDARFLAVPCRCCDAPAGELCRNARRDFEGGVHAVRRGAWREANPGA